MRNPRPSFFIVHPSLTLDRRPSLFIFHCSLFILLSLFILHSSFFITGCSSSTKPRTGSLSGRVILVNDTNDPTLDPVDFSGVLVGLYATTALDSTLTRINSLFPSTGVKVTDTNSFDHRRGLLIADTITDRDGHFSISTIIPGVYNLVFLKEGWGFSYCFALSVGEGENAFGSLHRSQLDATLYPEVLLPSVVSDDIHLKHSHVYRVTSNTVFLGNTYWEDSVTMLADEGCKIDFLGDITPLGVSPLLKFSTSSGIHSLQASSVLASFDKVSILRNNSSVSLSNLVIEYAYSGLFVQSKDLSISNSIVRYCAASALMTSAENTSIMNCNFTDNPSRTSTLTALLTLSSNIVANNGEAFYVMNNYSDISGNYFYGNEIALRSLYGDHVVKNNNFDCNNIAISASASIAEVFQNNFFKNDKDIVLSGYLRDYNLFDYCTIAVHDNNFYDSDFYVHLKGRSAYGNIAIPGVNSDQYYPNNYLKHIDLTQYIYDSSYPDPTLDLWTDVYVYFLPRRMSPYAAAGIQ